MGPRSKNTSSRAGRLHVEVDCRSVHPERQHAPPSPPRNITSRTAVWTSRLQGGMSRETTWACDQKHSITSKLAPWRCRLLAGAARETAWVHGQQTHHHQQGSRLRAGASRETTWAHDPNNIIVRRSALWRSTVDCRPAHPEEQHGPTVKPHHHKNRPAP